LITYEIVDIAQFLATKILKVGLLKHFMKVAGISETEL
jgi:hypothetical protein